MKTYQITLSIEIDAKDEDSARRLAADYKDKVSRLVVKPRTSALVPTRVKEVKVVAR